MKFAAHDRVEKLFGRQREQLPICRQHNQHIDAVAAEQLGAVFDRRERRRSRFGTQQRDRVRIKRECDRGNTVRAGATGQRVQHRLMTAMHTVEVPDRNITATTIVRRGKASYQAHDQASSNNATLAVKPWM